MRHRCASCSLLQPEGVVTLKCKCGCNALEAVSDTDLISPIPQEIGGDHYQQGVSTSPWDLQLSMRSSGSAYVDARRADTIKYAFRMKGDLKKLAEDLRKAADCAIAGAKEIERGLAEIASSIKSKIEKEEILKWVHSFHGQSEQWDARSNGVNYGVYSRIAPSGTFFNDRELEPESVIWDAIVGSRVYDTLCNPDGCKSVCEDHARRHQPASEKTPSSI